MAKPQDNLDVLFSSYRQDICGDQKDLEAVEEDAKQCLLVLHLSETSPGLWKSLYDNAVKGQKKQKEKGGEGWVPLYASAAWAQLEQYAVNLIHDQKNQQYHTIRGYNGYLKTTVEPNIPEFDKILKKMGYKKNEKRSTYDLRNMEREQDLLKVAFDCFLCRVQCGIMAKVVGKNPVPVEDLFTAVMASSSATDLKTTLYEMTRPPPVKRMEAANTRKEAPGDEYHKNLEMFHEQLKGMDKPTPASPDSVSKERESQSHLGKSGARIVQPEHVTVDSTMESQTSHTSRSRNEADGRKEADRAKPDLTVKTDVVMRTPSVEHTASGSGWSPGRPPGIVTSFPQSKLGLAGSLDRTQDCQHASGGSVRSTHTETLRASQVESEFERQFLSH